MIENIQSIMDFSLQGINEEGEEKIYGKNDFLGKILVVYFYPKDDTPGCTKESCAFNAVLAQINNKANIVGVSADSIDSHKKFKQKYSLKFPLLSDNNFILAQSLGATKKLLGEVKISRSTFLFDEKGQLLKSWYNVKVDEHEQDVLDEINKI